MQVLQQVPQLQQVQQQVLQQQHIGRLHGIRQVPVRCSRTAGHCRTSKLSSTAPQQQQPQQCRQSSTVCWAAAPRQPEQPVTPLQPYPPVSSAPNRCYAAANDGQGSVPLPSIPLPHITPPVPVRPSPALSWLPPQLATHLQALGGFLAACWALLPDFVAPSLSEAVRRLCLVLGASLAMVVLVSTIDSGWLFLYLVNARKVAVA